MFHGDNTALRILQGSLINVELPGSCCVPELQNAFCVDWVYLQKRLSALGQVPVLKNQDKDQGVISCVKNSFRRA